MTLATLFPDDNNDENLSAVPPHRAVPPQGASPAPSPSPCWVPLVRICKEQGIRYSFLYKKVTLASRQQCSWVRREPDPVARGRFRWCVDTASPSYHAHVLAWRQTSSLASAHHGLHAASGTSSSTWHTEPVQPTTPASLNTGSVQDILPHLCDWLSVQGLMIFQDALAPEHAWCWTWNGVLSKGHTTMAAALTAALEHRLMLLSDYERLEDSGMHAAPWAAWDAEQNLGGLDGLHALLDELDDAPSPQEEATSAHQQEAEAAEAIQETKTVQPAKPATPFSFWPLRL